MDRLGCTIRLRGHGSLFVVVFASENAFVQSRLARDAVSQAVWDSQTRFETTLSLE